MNEKNKSAAKCPTCGRSLKRKWSVWRCDNPNCWRIIVPDNEVMHG